MIAILLTFLAVILITYAIQEYVRNFDRYRKVGKVPGPPTLPFIGNAHHFLGGPKALSKKCRDLTNKYPSPYRVWLGNELIYVVFDPEQIKIILTSPNALDKGDIHKYIRKWLGNCIWTAEGSEWKRQRKLINPSFNQKILESYVQVFSEKANGLAKELEKEVDRKNEFNAIDYVTLYSHDTMYETVMGVPSNTLETKDLTYSKTVKRITEIIILRMMKVWLSSDIIFHWSKLGREYERLFNYIRSVSCDTIKRRREALKLEAESEGNTSNNTSVKITSILDRLLVLTDENQFTDKDLSEEVEVLMIGGSDSSSTTISFILLSLASYPEFQQKVYDELYEIYGDEDPNVLPVTSKDLPNMKYLERFIKEVLRLFPAGIAFSRRITEDLNIGEHTLVKNSTAIISLIMVHRLEEYWPDPMKFNPDRFLPEEITKRHPFAWIPFSSGPRNCIGLMFGMLSLKTVTATLVRKYFFKRDSKLVIEDIDLLDTFVDPSQLYKIKIEKRIKK